VWLSRVSLKDMERSRWPLSLCSIIFFALFLTWLPIAEAQDTPVADISLGYSPLYVIKGYTIWMNGGRGTVAVNANDWFGVAADFGGYVGHVPEVITGETYTFGPRFTYHKLGRLVPFGQALFGGSHFSSSTGGITGGGSQFAFALGGGADYLLGSRRKFAVRLEGNYFGIRSAGSTTPCARIAIGITYRIGTR
jgi:hypothetical protein